MIFNQQWLRFHITISRFQIAIYNVNGDLKSAQIYEGNEGFDKYYPQIHRLKSKNHDLPNP